MGEVSPPRSLTVLDLGLVPYGRALEFQRELVARRRLGEVEDHLLLLEHPPVITLGSGSSPDHVLVDDEERGRLGIELFEVGRGGDVTYHGPGQLVGYPVLDLKPDRKDLHRYLRDLEDVLIGTLRLLGVESTREEGFTGVWTQRGKVGAIGVRVSSGWITSHGFALNVATDLSHYRAIVPCGIQGRPVTSLQELMGRDVSIGEVVPHLIHSFESVFSFRSRCGPDNT